MTREDSYRKMAEAAGVWARAGIERRKRYDRLLTEDFVKWAATWAFHWARRIA